MEKFTKKDHKAVTFEYKPIQCDVCEKVFAARSTLKLHKEIEHEENNINDEVLQYEEHHVWHKSILNTDLQTGIKIEDYNWETITIEIDFGDVTLACEEKQIKAHKIILPGFTVQLKNSHHNYQDYFQDQVRVDYRNNNFDKKIDNFQLEETSVLWTQVSVDFKIQSRNPAIKSQNKIFQTF